MRFERRRPAPRRPTTVSVLGFSAVASGPDDADVLGMVDQLVGAAPVRAASCGTPTRRQGARRAWRGDRSEELAGVGIGASGAGDDAAPFPRVYPDVAGVVGGVVAETAPIADLRPRAGRPARVGRRAADRRAGRAGAPHAARHQRRRAHGRRRVDAREGSTITLGDPGRRPRRAPPFRRHRRDQLRRPDQRLDGGVAHRSPLAPRSSVAAAPPRCRSRSRWPPAADPHGPRDARTRVSVEVRSAMAVELHP